MGVSLHASRFDVIALIYLTRLSGRMITAAIQGKDGTSTVTHDARSSTRGMDELDDVRSTTKGSN